LTGNAKSTVTDEIGKDVVRNTSGIPLKMVDNKITSIDKQIDDFVCSLSSIGGNPGSKQFKNGRDL